MRRGPPEGPLKDVAPGPYESASRGARHCVKGRRGAQVDGKESCNYPQRHHTPQKNRSPKPKAFEELRQGGFTLGASAVASFVAATRSVSPKPKSSTGLLINGRGAKCTSLTPCNTAENFLGERDCNVRNYQRRNRGWTATSSTFFLEKGITALAGWLGG